MTTKNLNPQVQVSHHHLSHEFDVAYVDVRGGVDVEEDVHAGEDAGETTRPRESKQIANQDGSHR